MARERLAAPANCATLAKSTVIPDVKIMELILKHPGKCIKLKLKRCNLLKNAAI